MSKRKSAMKKAIVLVLGGVALYIIIVVVANLHLIAWWHSDQVNAQRLKVLQADGILHCSVPNIEAWREREEARADMPGTTHGIGFGGRSPTVVHRMYRFQSADPNPVMDAFAACARSSGWTLSKQPHQTWTGTKSFADGWTANLIIYVATIPPDNQPTVQIDLRAAPI